MWRSSSVFAWSNKGHYIVFGNGLRCRESVKLLNTTAIACLWFGAFLISGVGCNGANQRRDFEAEAALVGRWQCDTHAIGVGFELDADGTGHFYGPDWSNPRQFLRWRVTRSGSVHLLEHGEEGEHGDYVEYSYTQSQNHISIKPAVNGCFAFTKARAKNAGKE